MINILPYNQKEIIKKTRTLRVVSTLVWGIVILIFMAGLLMVPTLMTVNSRYKIALNQVAVFEKDGSMISLVDVNSLENRTRNVLNKLSAPPIGTPIVYINLIKGLTPKGIDIDTFSVSDVNTPRVDIAGVASTREKLQNFISILEKNENIESVNSPISNFVKSTNANFNISIVFKKK